MGVIVGGPVGAHLNLRLLVDLEKLQQIQDEFAADTGLAMITVDATGTPVTEPSQFSPLCQVLRKDPRVRRLCYSCDAHGGLQAAIDKRPFIYQCHAGLVDFAVAITTDSHYLGAVMCGQVLLREGQTELSRISESSRADVGADEFENLFSQAKKIDLARLNRAASDIVELVNSSLTTRTKVSTLSAQTGPWFGRVADSLAEAEAPAQSQLASLATRGPLIKLQPEFRQIDKTMPNQIAQNLQRADVAANFELLGNYLDRLLPRWSQKLPRSALGEFEDMLIGLATGESVQCGRDLSQLIIRNRNRRDVPMNRYESQVYCERLLVQLHNLVEPQLTPKERTIGTLLNEVAKDPTRFLTLRRAAEFLLLSESHFARKFKAATGQSFISYVTEKRLERAKFMLLHTDKPVLKIAAELCFQPVNYFSRTFKRHVGVSPSEYRARGR
ncbi:MAG: hypothetical protein CSA64_02410 [Arachnia propionica]|nr:MAG: hypothetical protein CSA64_02410 [Arachnia propionica]